MLDMRALISTFLAIGVPERTVNGTASGLLDEVLSGHSSPR